MSDVSTPIPCRAVVTPQGATGARAALQAWVTSSNRPARSRAM